MAGLAGLSVRGQEGASTNTGYSQPLLQHSPVTMHSKEGPAGQSSVLVSVKLALLATSQQFPVGGPADTSQRLLVDAPADTCSWFPVGGQYDVCS